MSGGLRTSVKAYINGQRLTSLAENNEAINTHLAPIAETAMAAASTNSYGLCDGNIPCLPILSSATKSCEANQLPPAADHICVNGQPLSPEELVVLQTCPNPPKKLKPGNYWYDHVCGFWGKEGQKPSELISPQLCVGGCMKANASNGNTRVFINGREITKVELRMLKLIGVQCTSNYCKIYFWVSEDGSYWEEGMNNVEGYIWGKASAKFVCAVLSLPFPSKSSKTCGEPLNNVGSRVIPDYIEQRTLQKILLVGYNGSGASTIFKQAKFLHNIPFSEDEREYIKFTIQRNVYGYLGILLEGRERFEEECLAEMRRQCSSSRASGNNCKTLYSIGPRLKAFSDWLLKTMVSGYLEAIFPAATREFAPLVEELWNDSAIQATYKRISELEMLPNATYFVNRVVHILRIDYEPTDLDILYAEGDTSSDGLACVDFSFPQLASEDGINQHNSLLRYQLIRVNAGLGESSQWLEMCGDVGMVIFCVSLSDYDQFSADGNGSLTNKMLQSRAFLESIITHPTFEQMNFLLILNEFNWFEEKIGRVPLTQCNWFHDFNPLYTSDLGHRAYEYIAVKFKRLYSSLTGKKLYVSLVDVFEPYGPYTVDEALIYSAEIFKWDEVRGSYFPDPDPDYSDSDSGSD